MLEMITMGEGGWGKGGKKVVGGYRVGVMSVNVGRSHGKVGSNGI